MILTKTKQFILLSNLIFAQSLQAQSSSQLDLNFYYGSEKKEWIDQVTPIFNQQQFRTKAGKIIRVNATARGSGDLVEMAQMDNPPEQIHVASPASQLYIEIGNTRYARSNSGKTLLQDQGALVNSPVVIAMWEPIAREMGWPNNKIGWSDIMVRAQNDRNFKFGHTNPHRSNSGLSALVAQFYAGYQAAKGEPTRILTSRHVEDTEIEKFVSRVQETMSLYGESTGFYAKQLIDGGPESLSAAVIYESDVVARNKQITREGLNRPKLIAIYPSEGTLATNHPYAIVNRAWTTPEHREAAELYFKFLMSSENQSRALQMGFQPELAEDFDLEEIFKDETGTADSGSATFLPTPKGEVLELILQNWRRLKNRSKSVVIFDRSGSMSEGSGYCRNQLGQLAQGVICNAREGAKEILTNLGERDQTLLMNFDDSFEVSHAMKVWTTFQPGQNVAFTPMTPDNKKNGQDLFDLVLPRGRTALYSAIHEAHRLLCEDIKRNKNDNSIRAIFVLTDGINTRGISPFDESPDLMRKIGYLKKERNWVGQSTQWGDQNCKIRVFGIAYNVRSVDDQIFKDLRDVSLSTGGEAVIGRPEKIKEIFRKLGDFL